MYVEQEHKGVHAILTVTGVAHNSYRQWDEFSPAPSDFLRADYSENLGDGGFNPVRLIAITTYRLIGQRNLEQSSQK